LAVAHSLLVIARASSTGTSPYGELGAEVLLCRHAAGAHIRRLVY
jgi:hypothetical protein